MGKYAGKIGFAEHNVEEDVDVWDDQIVERNYYGDLVSNNRRYDPADTLSGNVTYTNQFSIVGDTYLFENLANIRYITWKRNRWVVSSADEHYPRVTISIGGLYNGPTSEVKRCSKSCDGDQECVLCSGD